jgi:hypothetical protein
MPGRRVYYHASRLVNQEDIVILITDIQRDGLSN